jgi:hypothetical protein
MKMMKMEMVGRGEEKRRGGVKEVKEVEDGWEGRWTEGNEGERREASQSVPEDSVLLRRDAAL